MRLDRPGPSLAERLASDPDELARFLRELSEEEAALLAHDWSFWGRPAQQAPPGEWSTWVLCTGRAWGKTDCESQWVNDVAERMPGSHGALVSRTAADVRDTMVLGISGLLAKARPWNPCEYVGSQRLVRWRNGTTAHLYSSEEPDQLRGPNFHWGAGDEVATWLPKVGADGFTALDNLRFATRLSFGPHQPRLLLGSTPRRTEIMLRLIAEAEAEPGMVLTRGHTLENRANLSPVFLQEILRRYAGTRMGRQELAGELLTSIEGALLHPDQIDAARVGAAPKVGTVARIVVGVDPSGGADLQGIVAAGIAHSCPCGNGAPLPHGFVLADDSVQLTPGGWGGQVVATYQRLRADTVLGESNYGGAMVEHTIRTAPGGLSVRYVAVNASRGKHIRAEPVISLYEQKRVHHVGYFPELEEELCGFTAEKYAGTGSPNRADALVWALTHLLVEPSRSIRIS